MIGQLVLAWASAGKRIGGSRLANATPKVLWGTDIELYLPREVMNCMSDGIETLLTSKEASRVLKIHPKVLERMAKRGEVPALKVGKFWRYRATTLDAWIKPTSSPGCGGILHGHDSLTTNVKHCLTNVSRYLGRPP